MIVLCLYANAQTPPGETQILVKTYTPPASGTTVTPMVAGFANPSRYYTFRIAYQDVLGFQDIFKAQILFTDNPLTDLNYPNLANTCNVRYDNDGWFALRDDTGVDFNALSFPIADMPDNTLDNTQCSLIGDGTRVVSASGAFLTIDYQVAFTGVNVSNTVYVYGFARNSGDTVRTGYVQLGTINVTVGSGASLFTAQVPKPQGNGGILKVVGNGVGSAPFIYQAVYTDKAGWQDINHAEIIFDGAGFPASQYATTWNPSTGHYWTATDMQKNSCVGMVAVSAVNPTFYLLADDGATWLGPAASGSTTVLGNSRCKLYADDSRVIAGSDTITVNFKMSFTWESVCGVVSPSGNPTYPGPSSNCYVAAWVNNHTGSSTGFVDQNWPLQLVDPPTLSDAEVNWEPDIGQVGYVRPQECIRVFDSVSGAGLSGFSVTMKSSGAAIGSGHHYHEMFSIPTTRQTLLIPTPSGITGPAGLWCSEFLNDGYTGIYYALATVPNTTPTTSLLTANIYYDLYKRGAYQIPPNNTFYTLKGDGTTGHSDADFVLTPQTNAALLSIARGIYVTRAAVNRQMGGPDTAPKLMIVRGSLPLGGPVDDKRFSGSYFALGMLSPTARGPKPDANLWGKEFDIKLPGASRVFSKSQAEGLVETWVSTSGCSYRPPTDINGLDMLQYLHVTCPN